MVLYGYILCCVPFGSSGVPRSKHCWRQNSTTNSVCILDYRFTCAYGCVQIFIHEWICVYVHIHSWALTHQSSKNVTTISNNAPSGINIFEILSKIKIIYQLSSIRLYFCNPFPATVDSLLKVFEKHFKGKLWIWWRQAQLQISLSSF